MATAEGLALDELVAPMHFSPQLEAAIQEVMPSTDPLDAADFNPTAHINRLFPNEESLSEVDTHVSGLQDRMRELDEEVLRTVRQQTSAGSSARKDLENAKASVAELFLKVRDIKTKAEQSEEMVHEICHDIKSLDYAKRHLTLTITALKRLQMLVTAVEQLSVMAQERMYAEAANLLQAVNSLLVHFTEYANIKKVQQLLEQIAEVKGDLRKQVFEDFNKLSESDQGAEGVQPGTAETLKGACLVVDALGPETRQEMVAWFCGWQFAPYKHAFQPFGEFGSLEKTELRYKWHEKMLERYAASLKGLFPPSWRVALALSRDFCSISCKHLEEILDQSRGSLDVAVLTHALQKTVDFEEELHRRHRREHREEEAAAATTRQRGGGGGSEEEGEEGERSVERRAAAEGVAALLGSISACFDSYMGIYVSLADKTLEERIGKVLGDESWAVQPAGRADTRVFTSSKELFIAIKKSYKLGTQMKNKAVLLDLHKVWGKHLKAYARKVQEQLPPISQPTDPSLPPSVSLDLLQQQSVCAVVNTCEYCSETTGQLADTVSKQLDGEQAELVNLEGPQEDFQGAVMAGMRVLVATLESRVAGSLQAMTRVPWGAMEEMGDDTSAYMSEIVDKLREMLPQLGEALLPLYVRWFCDKLVASLVPRLIGSIYRCRRIGESGAQQIQMDVGALKATLLDLPSLGQASATGAYTKLVTSEVGKAEQILKLVQTPDELLEETVASLRRSGAAVDLQKIQLLKGLKEDKLADAFSMASASAADMKKIAAEKMANMGNIAGSSSMGKKMFGQGS